MLGAQLVRGRSRAANHDRHTDLPPGHVADLRRIVHDLIHREDREVKGHHLDDGMESGHGGADRQAGKSQFGDRRIDDAPRAKLFQEALANLEGALIIGDILADQEDLLVAPHLFPQRLVERFPIGKSHCTRPPWASIAPGPPLARRDGPFVPRDPPRSPGTRPPWASIAPGPPAARRDGPLVPWDPTSSPVYISSARVSTAGTGLVSAKSTASSTTFLTSSSRVLKSASAAPRSSKSLVLSRSSGSRFFASSTSLLVR